MKIKKIHLTILLGITWVIIEIIWAFLFSTHNSQLPDLGTLKLWEYILLLPALIALFCLGIIGALLSFNGIQISTQSFGLLEIVTIIILLFLSVCFSTSIIYIFDLFLMRIKRLIH